MIGEREKVPISDAFQERVGSESTHNFGTQCGADDAEEFNYAQHTQRRRRWNAMKSLLMKFFHEKIENSVGKGSDPEEKLSEAAFLESQ